MIFGYGRLRIQGFRDLAFIEPRALGKDFEVQD